MKRSTLILFALAGVINALTISSNWGILGMVALPFALAGKLLRWLSLAGAAGNLAAIVVYALVCLSPLSLKWKRKWNSEDWLLVLTSLLLFWVMYLMVNPGMMQLPFTGDDGSAIYVGSVLSVLLAWGVMKLLKVSRAIRQEKVYEALRIFLLICAAQFIFTAFSKSVWNIQSAISNAQMGGIYTAFGSIGVSVAFQLVMSAAVLMEYCFDAAVMLRGAELLRQVEQDPYSEGCMEAAEDLGSLCYKALVCITLTNVALNVAQILLAGYLSVYVVALNLPAMSLALVFGALALTKLLSQGRELKEDNDLFI